ncbi:hypothetical protein TRFO_43218 [Tritrichomonas foetus]|uniref:Uncharacterized protein n=1 Tax=Tritrichomonas foetus TaxID=1144522 RepID=A0A1J4KVW4_9EUKA|nr:hypothetical protein TRFO_08489 [Tritrichomonas foetus]OHS99243.1 hypothetical protein TRFO_08491 [Tritrichomonas foetus]OHS99245.1 hypothetical protein TRFO_08493 [Tritrichomonas foetus]OHT13892.1 hypothetical protein TRFO_43218 [Tritrichomonas foetus]|eukprot:OHS99241.1 hypothetical protein TRFO_08489 [Tritrichomonas foetus]
MFHISASKTKTNQIKELYNFFEETSIFNHFSLDEALLHIFVHLSKYFQLEETKEEQIHSTRREIDEFFFINELSQHSKKKKLNIFHH